MIKKQFGELESKIFLKFQNPLFFEKVIQLWSAQKVLRLKNSRKEKFFNHPNAPKNERVPPIVAYHPTLPQGKILLLSPMIHFLTRFQTLQYTWLKYV